MARLIDTSALIELERRGQPLRALLASAPDETWAIAGITAAELLLGVERADSPARRGRRSMLVEEVLADLPVLPFDLPVTRVHARVAARLLAAGRVIGAHDLLIAATALAHGYAVLTHNLRHFERVPDLVVHRPNW